jgi:hypothetical protein
MPSGWDPAELRSLSPGEEEEEELVVIKESHFGAGVIP